MHETFLERFLANPVEESEGISKKKSAEVPVKIADEETDGKDSLVGLPRQSLEKLLEKHLKEFLKKKCVQFLKGKPQNYYLQKRL